MTPAAPFPARRRGHRSPFTARLLSLLAVTVVLHGASASLAAPPRESAIPPPTRVERFHPDLQACQAQSIRAGFVSQLQPWADQPPAVLEQLRRVQREMTLASLQRCVSKGLLQASEATELERQLGLQPVVPSAPGSGPAPAGVVPGKL